MVCARALQTSNPGSLELSKFMVLHHETIGVMLAKRESKETSEFLEDLAQRVFFQQLFCLFPMVESPGLILLMNIQNLKQAKHFLGL